MKRRGGILLEAVVGTLLLSLLMVSTAQILSLMQRQSRFMSQRTVALQECHIALVSLANRTAAERDAKALTEFSLPLEAASLLPDGKLEVLSEPSAVADQGARLRVKVTWRPAPGADPASVELSCWRFDLPNQAGSSGGSP